MLFCSDVDGYLGLLLTRCPDSPDRSRPLYHIGWNVTNELGDYRTIRLINWGRDLSVLTFAGNPVIFEWKQIYLAHRLPPEPKPTSRSLDTMTSMPFRISPSAFTELMQRGWEAYPKTQIPHGWTDAHTIDLIFHCPGPGSTRIWFAMGRCPLGAEPLRGSSKHWASFWVSPTETPLAENPPPHNCLQDHISEWPGGRKLFGGSQGGYALPMVVCFTPCPRNPDKTMVLSAANFGRRHRFGASWFSRDALLNSGRIDSR